MGKKRVPSSTPCDAEADTMSYEGVRNWLVEQEAQDAALKRKISELEVSLVH